MFKEAFSTIAEWVLTYMLTSISKRLYPDEKVAARVRIVLKDGVVSIPPNDPLVRMTLEIRNTLASRIKLHSIHGDVWSEGYILINNFTKDLDESLDKHSDKSDCSITLDLPVAGANIAKNHRAETILLRLSGVLRFNAIGRELTRRVDTSMFVRLKGLHGDI